MSDYVDMLIAAGWVEPSALNSEYQKYLQSPYGCQEDTLSYEDWQWTIQENIRLGKEHDKLHQDYDRNDADWWTNGKKARESKKLLDAMSYNEWWLRV